MDTINAGLIAPTGYTRSYTRMRDIPCEAHADYRPFCPNCVYVVESVPVALEGDVIALILDREDGSVIDWIKPDYYTGLVQTLAHQGVAVIREDVWDDLDAYPAARALAYEAELYADCFGYATDTLPESEA